MKKKIVILVAVVLTFGAVAQTNQPSREQMRREWRQMTQQRDYSNQIRKNIPQAPATKGETKQTGHGMPQTSYWFPGEWEEVQAIVVTCLYNYYPVDHVGDMYWAVDPLVANYGDYYHWGSYGWQEAGSGAYVGQVDTTDDDFGNVFYYLMDAIQMGGAEAWVRVEQLSDSSVIKQRLQSMNLRNNNMRFIEGHGNAYWFRDCGPICFYYGEGDTVGMLDFEYSPGRALDDSLPVYIERQVGIPNYNTMIEWEGGNCLVDGAGMLFTSDAVYAKNRDTKGQLTWNGTDPNTIRYATKPSISSAQVKDSLRALIGTRATYILPAFKYDGGTGHVDLYADMLDENLFVFSKMPDVYSNWYDYGVGNSNMDSLCSYQSFFGANYRSRFIPFPSTNNGGNFPSQVTYNRSYTRTYSNHTFVNNLIIQPCFSRVGSDGMPTAEWDRANIVELKKAYPGYTIYCVDVREFDGSGGAIHCVTKQIPAEHPIRILHQALYDNTGIAYINQGAPVVANITNVDGIDSAVVVYRIANGQWNELTMTPDQANNYAAVIPTSGQNSGQYTQVDYYIRATSNAGKTITKPMTALQGGYYTFYLGENPNVGVEQVAEGEHFGQFFPNPAGEVAHMRVEFDGDARYDVTILDVTGRTVHTTSLQATGSVLYTVNTALLPSGLYSVVFRNNSERVVRKLIVR